MEVDWKWGMRMELELKNLSCGYGKRTIVDSISLTIREGEVISLLGANGCGKTTLLKTILGLIESHGGQVLLDGEDIQNWSPSRIARVIGYIPQLHEPPFPFQVLDVVLMGRTPHIKPFSSPTKKDEEIARRSLEWLNIAHLEKRIYTEISGGERQLVLIARALAQEPKMLIMDEPTSSLDFGNQVKVLNHIQQLGKLDMAVLMSCHFPEHAFLYSNRVVLLNQGEILCSGSPSETITGDRLKTLYGVDVEIVTVRNRANKEIKVCIPSGTQVAEQEPLAVDWKPEYAAMA